MLSLVPPDKMLPFEAPTIFEQLPRFLFNAPKVVGDQKAKFESDEQFRRLSRECEVRYMGYRDRPLHERRVRFQNACREGMTEVVFPSTGTNMQLVFNPCVNGYSDCCDFDKERGKVHIKASFIMNGVCVRWKGWVDLERLDGVASLEFDEERAAIEDAILKEQIERYKARMREFEERHGIYKSDLEKQQHASEAHNGDAQIHKRQKTQS